MGESYERAWRRGWHEPKGRVQTKNPAIADRTSTACGSFRRTLEHIETYQIKNVLETKEQRTLVIAKNKTK